MNHLSIELGLACKNSKDFIDMLGVYLGHHLEINLGRDVKPLYNKVTHISILEVHVHYIRKGKLRGLLPDAHVNGTLRIILDNGWEWVSIELDNLSEKDISDHLLCIKAFIEEIKSTNPDMFGEFDPSERYD
jgi:hypothetical protein